MIDDITPGRNSEHQIHEYQYDDTQYEIKYAYDFVLDTPFAKEQHKKIKEIENLDKKNERDVDSFIKKCSDNYETQCKKLLQ